MYFQCSLSHQRLKGMHVLSWNIIIVHGGNGIKIASEKLKLCAIITISCQESYLVLIIFQISLSTHCLGFNMKKLVYLSSSFFLLLTVCGKAKLWNILHKQYYQQCCCPLGGIVLLCRQTRIPWEWMTSSRSSEMTVALYAESCKESRQKTVILQWKKGTQRDSCSFTLAS